MNYEQSINYIYSRRKFAKDGSHRRISHLLSLMGNPQNSLKFVHVVGTNGKGSTCTYTASVLREAGYTVGLFTSPFVIEFGERIQVNGEFINRNIAAEIAGEIREYIEKMHDDLQPNVFEVTTALAFSYFAKMNCDIVVLEAGIGGEHDTTNVILPPLVSIFTSISLDHTNLLGNTVKEIATEKSGIIKTGSSVVSYPENSGEFEFTAQAQEVINIIKQKCGKLSCEFFQANTQKLEIISTDIAQTDFVYCGEKYTTSLMGQHQVANAITAITAIKQLQNKGFNITQTDIQTGISKAQIMGRMQVLSTSPLIIADGGHNEGCMKQLGSVIGKHLKGKDLCFVMSFVKGKDYMSSFDIILPYCSKLILTTLHDGSNEDLEALMSYAEKHCKEVSKAKNSEEALELAKLSEKDAIIVAGSFYLVSEILELKK
ncbi:MAG: folylpolyglutamate synthase/dihydrofolate synthase family protein [Clostridia bacterium]